MRQLHFRNFTECVAVDSRMQLPPAAEAACSSLLKVALEHCCSLVWRKEPEGPLQRYLHARSAMLASNGIIAYLAGAACSTSCRRFIEPWGSCDSRLMFVWLVLHANASNKRCDTKTAMKGLRNTWTVSANGLLPAASQIGRTKRPQDEQIGDSSGGDISLAHMPLHKVSAGLSGDRHSSSVQPL